MEVIKTVLLIFVLCIGFSFQYPGPYDDCTCLGYEEVYAKVGDYITLECNDSSINETINRYIYLWQIPRHRSNSGPKWHHFTVDEEYTGLYKCYVFTKKGDILVDEVCVSIYEEVFFKWFKKPNVYPDAYESEDFKFEFEVEGSPHPVTVLTPINTGVILAQVHGSGVHNMTIQNVTCVDKGYHITASNAYSNASTMLPITVIGRPRPDPKFPDVNTLTRRIGQIATFEAHILGCPPPTFTWTHGNVSYLTGTQNGSYTKNTVQVSSFKDFGVYELEIKNIAGICRTYFTLLAEEQVIIKLFKRPDVYPDAYEWEDFNLEFEVEGSPDPVTELTNIETGVKLAHFYGSGVHNVSIQNVTCVDNRQYQLTASNVYSNDSMMLNIIVAGPPRPDPKFPVVHTLTRRIGQIATFEAHILGCPPPTFTWTHGNVSYLTSTQNGSYTANTFQVSSSKDFGIYELEMEHFAGLYRTYFTLLAEGPPEPPNTFSVSGLTTAKVSLSWITGYDYNKTQTFTIYRHINSRAEVFFQAKDTTGGHGNAVLTQDIDISATNALYNLTIVSQNADGNSAPSDFLVFLSYGMPKEDPNKNVTLIVESRLYERVCLEMTAIGYPPPLYEWYHYGERLKSSDLTYSSEVIIESMTLKDYGNYTLIMTNIAGTSIYNYLITAYGPPDAVSDIELFNLTTTSVAVDFRPGYNYTNEQFFKIHIETFKQGMEIDILINDTTNGIEDSRQNYTVNHLEPGTDYTLTIIACNKEGYAYPSPTVHFRTEGPPDAASDIKVLNITDTSVIFDFRPGFNYHKEQFFKLHIETSKQGMEIDILINDTTNGIEDSRQNYTVNRLEPDTDYNLTIIACNKEGYADPSPTVHFRTEVSTKSGPMAVNKTDSMADNLLIICGSTGLVIISVLIALRYRKRKRADAEVVPLSSGEEAGCTHSKGPTMDSMNERTSLTTAFVNNDYSSLLNAMDTILKVIDLGHLIEQFKRKAVGPNEVLELSDDDLISLGVTTLDQKIRLLRACRNYPNEGNKANTGN